jgi:hypothetical protein
VFYFGSAIGETGAGNITRFSVTSSDEADVRNHPSSALAPTPIGSPWDINRDGPAGSGDQSLVRQNVTSAFNGLVFLNVGAGGPFAPDATPESPAAASTVLTAKPESTGDWGITSGLAAAFSQRRDAERFASAPVTYPIIPACDAQAIDAYFRQLAEPAEAALSGPNFLGVEGSGHAWPDDDEFADTLISGAS